jgi:hypothetical protein
MTKLVFEYVGDIRAVHPYYHVYTSDQMSLYQQDPFLEIAVEKEGNLVITIEARKEVLHLTLEQWEEILVHARKYHQETLDSTDDWP